METEVITLVVKPYVGYRFLDYEVYKFDDQYVWVVNWVNSQTKEDQYYVNDSGGA